MFVLNQILCLIASNLANLFDHELMTLRFLPALFFLLLFSAVHARAQESITFEQLTELLDPYFAPELVGDITKALPEAPFDVWGFDVGDYSGDGYNDLIVSIRLHSNRRNEMKIYYFVDIEGILEVVRQETVKFVELPIEVGVTINDGNAYLIQKREEFSWEMFGRRYRDGVVMLVDRYSTSRNLALIHEQYRHYQKLEGFERFLRVKDETELFRADFLTVPSYRRGRHVSAGYARTATASLSPFLVRGAYYWSGVEDLQVNLRSAWDPEYLYFNVLVDDDEIVPESADTDTIGDRVELWLDMYMYGDRFTTGSRKQAFRNTSDTNIYGLFITLGDLVEKDPEVKISTTNLFDEGQNRATSRIRAAAARRDSGWMLKIRVPFALFGFDVAPIDEERLLEIGATVVVQDLDNPWRPTETTVMATSHNFDSNKPVTYGAVILVPPSVYFGESENIFTDQVKERLQEVGY